jgi:phage-related protein
MGTQLASAYVQIIPSAKGMKGMITEELGGEASSAGSSAGESFGSNMISKLKTIIAAAGIGTIIKEAITQGADLEQSIGGVETLFKDSADTVKAYADEAYKTAGMSANEYMETVTGFSASLLQGLGGDTAAAAEIADMAITDMSDNANKMGTDMSSIQNAYQGFAKQNYTMLDNLKLGYGGTKSEMERLLADAQEISGVEYNIDNLSDVYQAIHVIQGELDITVTTAKEAATTLSGSMASMKAAATNLLGNLALGEDIGPSLDELMDTVSTFLLDNLFPMVGNILGSAPELLSGAISILIRGLNIASAHADEIVQMGLDVISQLVIGLIDGVPYLIEGAVRIAASLGEALINTDWIGTAKNMINSIRDNLELAGEEILGTDGSIIEAVAQGIVAQIPVLKEQALGIITTVGDLITEHLPDILNDGIAMITSLANGLLEALPEVISSIGEILVELVGYILENIPTIIDAGMKLISNLAKGLLDNLPEVLSSIGKILVKLLAKIAENMPKIYESGYELIGKFVSGLIKAVPKVISAIVDMIKSMVSEFKNYDWISIGGNIVSGIVNGLKNGISSIVSAAQEVASSALNAAKSYLGIASPSKRARDEIGKWIPKGVAVGIETNLDDVSDAMAELKDQVSGGIQTDIVTEIASGQLQIDNSISSGGYKTQESGLSQMQGIMLNIYSMMEEYMPQLANMQIVTDTGVLAGELAGAMDYELGAMATKRNRGR